VLVGAEAPFFDVPPPPADGPVRITYVGGFLPLHGVGTMLEAFARLERDPALRDPLSRPIGRRWHRVRGGQSLPRTRTAAGRRVHRTTLVRRPAAGAASTHIMLGAFGAGAKTGRVIPHKLWQGLAAGRAVVTGDGPGPRELFTDDRELRLVPRADAEALAAALAALIGDAAHRAALGTAGQARAREWGHPDGDRPPAR
jgi:hypothetical protein